MPLYDVQISRDTSQYATIRVEASSPEEADQMALRLAADLKTVWSLSDDRGAPYLNDPGLAELVEGEELNGLRDELKAIGFSDRAIKAAMKDLNRKEAV